MANYDLSTVMNLADAQVMYKDLRDRMKEIEVPVEDVKVAGVSVVVDGIANIPAIPTVPVTDVQINGTTILNNGVASVPMAGTDLGVSRIDSNFGIRIITSGDNVGKLSTYAPSDVMIQTGLNSYRPLTPVGQHKAVFFGLSKVAGYDLNGLEVTLGTYPDASKQAIQKLFGLDGIFGDYQNGITASKAYAVGDTFIMDGKRYKVTTAISDGGLITVGTNCELDPLDGRCVRNTDIATTTKRGVVKIDPNYGISLRDAPNQDVLMINRASDSEIKTGEGWCKPIVPGNQYKSVFYGFAKAAGDTTQSQSDNAVGTYTAEAKAAIQTMLGIEADIPLIEEVSGASPSITGMPNVRYICGTVSTLSITPPASGSIVVRFTSGATATLLTVPNTVKFPAWFDPTSLEADTVYEIIITDGVYGGVMSWAA